MFDVSDAFFQRILRDGHRVQILAHRAENRHRNGPVMADSRMKLSVMRADNAQITFADLEFLQQGIRLDPLLEKISDFLDDHNKLVELIRRDLERGLKEPETGRPGLTPDQVLRSLILMRVKNWDYRELRERINDGYTLRDRKSTRLNSSHLVISYAVFCLKKKKKHKRTTQVMIWQRIICPKSKTT